ncbi:histone-binding protein N1/N2-like [Pseudochaenichthys georgianus]|uniref:histone-binding protein N1/N2-like n=1 Tax=Pseudochaenichthys georgianus TaxID=52239 RepID=UPI00146F6A8B|nr:nuclear autoantigenic sperm protein-like [Pseudochaenichthys georgianus]
MEEAKKLIGTGKKHLVMGKVVEAVGALQEACGLLAKKYGDTADECGEAFFWCGRALLDLARMENSVLGNALEGVPEEDEDEGEKPKDSNVDSTENMDEKTRDELRAQVYDAMAEKKNEDSEKKNEDSEKETEDSEKETEDSENDSEEKKGDVEKGDKHKDAAEKDEKNVEVKESKFDKSEEKMETEKESGDKEEDAQEEGEEAEMEGDTEGGEGDSAEKDSDDDDEVVGNLQLSWEMLEVAKVIYKRKESKEDQLMAAQTYLKLGEVSSESGNYTQAMEDFQECLKLQVKHLDPDSRLLAETHYQLGLTYALNLQYRQAIEELNSSSSVIKSRLDKLKQLLEKAEGPEALPEERKEMEELKALLPEIQEKVEDATEGLKITRAAAEGARGVLDGGSTSSAFPGSTALPGDSSSSSKIKVTSTNGHASKSPASDISHLVRKKRKPEESPVKEEGVTKKLKQNNGQANGH